LTLPASRPANAFVMGTLGLGALAFAAFGVQWLANPIAMAQPLGIILTNGDATSDARAVYGGLELGMAMFLAYSCWSPKRRTQGLAAGALTLLGLGTARLIGILLAPEGVSSSTLGLLATDFTGVALFTAAFFVSRSALVDARGAPSGT
jgi:Domain of unknown function (DUF4345)